MRDPHNIIKRPFFTEKSTFLKESDNKFVIEVDKKANKIEIKKAFEELFEIKVEKVATVNVRGKTKKWGRSVGQTSAIKKAIVTLKKGEKLDFIEGV